MSLTAAQLAILQHALGLDEHGMPRPGVSRNSYVADPDADLARLVALGLMDDRGAWSIADGMHAYVVTDAGRVAVREQSPRPPKVSRSRERYQRWLEVADCFDFGFGEWLRRGLDREVE